MKYVMQPATEQNLGEMYNISRAAHRLEEYGHFIPPAGIERFRERYRWSKRRRELYIRKMTGYIQNPAAIVLVAKKGKAIAGYALAVYDSPAHLVLKSLFVRPSYQGQGIGKALFTASHRDVPPGTVVELEVLAKNARAQALYMQQGFTVSGVARKRFFGAELVTMTKRLD
jgi:ribosomal protein S18 acetylase RimI-like enzyme